MYAQSISKPLVIPFSKVTVAYKGSKFKLLLVRGDGPLLLGKNAVSLLI